MDHFADDQFGFWPGNQNGGADNKFSSIKIRFTQNVLNRFLLIDSINDFVPGRRVSDFNFFAGKNIRFRKTELIVKYEIKNTMDFINRFIELDFLCQIVEKFFLICHRENDLYNVNRDFPDFLDY